MDTAIQTLGLPINSTEVTGALVDGIASFQLASGQLMPEQQLRQAADRVVRLRSEVNELRRALAQARRRQLHQELLLRNSRLREFELRATLIERRQANETQIEK